MRHNSRRGLPSPAKRVRQTTKFFGCLHHGKGPSGAQGTPWEGTLGSPRDPHGRDPWEPKGSHGRGTLGSPRDPMGGDPREPKESHGRGPLGAQGIPWEGTLGSPRDPMRGDPWEPKGSHGREPKGAQGPPRLSLKPAGVSRTILEVFCVEVTFQEIQHS